MSLWDLWYDKRVLSSIKRSASEYVLHGEFAFDYNLLIDIIIVNSEMRKRYKSGQIVHI